MADLSGQTFGRYQLIERMGRGGMADVYKAFQPGLDRFVAIKVLHPHLSEDPDFTERFKREAKSVAALRHPYIINVIDFDTYDGPLGIHQFMVMTYIESGRTLKEVLIERTAMYQWDTERDPLSTDQALDIATKLADALHYAHQQGMVHRDIKPANVLLPELNQPLLSDFGIARILGQTGLTASGAMIGTPAYMSPEQCKGESADERSDIYALGIVLYEMLIGRPPFDADTPYGVIIKHINEPLLMPENLSPPLPDSVLRVLYTSLAKNPAERYQSAGDMRDALLRALKALPDESPSMQDTLQIATQEHATKPTLDGMEYQKTVPMTEPGAATPVPATRRRFPVWAYGLIGLVALGVLIGGVLLISGMLSGGGEDQVGPAELVVDEQPAGEASSPGQSESPGGDDQLPPTIDNVDYDALIAEALSSEDPGFITDIGTNTLIFLQDNERAFELFNAALALDPENPEALGGRAVVEMFNGDHDAARPDIEAALSQDDHNQAAHLARGLLLLWSDIDYDPDGAFESFSIVIEQCDQNRGYCAFALSQRAGLWAFDRGDPDQAIADSMRAVETNPNPYVQAGMLADQGQLRDQLGDLEGAAASFEQAYASSDQEAYYLRVATAILLRLGDLDRAQGFLNELSALSPGDPQLIADQGYLDLLRGDTQSALDAAVRAQTLAPDMRQAQYLLGLAQREAGDIDAAVGTFEGLIDVPEWEYEFPFYNRDLGHSLFLDLAITVLQRDDRDAALAYIDREVNERDSWWVEPFVLRADILIEAGDLPGAQESLAHALDIARDIGDEPWIIELERRLDELGT